MKTTDKLILISGLIFGLLFYLQDIGLNYFIFSLIQLLGLYLVTDKTRRTRHWWLVFTGVAISSIGALLYGSILAVVTNWISLFVLASISIEPGASLVISLFQNIYTLGTGVIHLITDFAQRAADQTGWKGTSKVYKKLIVFLVSLGIAGVFIALYRNSNQAFKELTDKIDLSFISGDWIIFTLFGYFLVYFMYKPRFIEKIRKYDADANDAVEEGSEGITAKWMSVQSELLWARTLLIMLNVVLGVVFCSELLYELGGLELADPIGHSENVHKGINAIIFSIVLAVSVILFFFQGRLNFLTNNSSLKWLGIAWVSQNMLLVLLTAWKNWLYVEEYFLTYKRIGVFVYLTCCLIGLIFTFIKLNGLRSNWFLVRRVGWGIYATLLLTPIVNWDALIINYNFSRAKENPENLDIDYLLTLPEENYPLIQHKLKESKTVFITDQEQVMDELIAEFRQHALDYDWRSFNFRKYVALQTTKDNTPEKSLSYAD